MNLSWDLQAIWFFLWGLLWAVFFITGGFDLGIGVIFPWMGKGDGEKRTIIHALGPLWDGNEVWLITAGGVTFAAFPLVYATMFSSLYSALMLILFGLILRGVSFEFRSKVESPGWRKIWDTTIFIGSLLPALLLGVAFANIFQGIPFDKDGIYHGTLFTLLNPYGLLGGLLFLLLFCVHGALWLCIRTEGAVQNRAIAAAAKMWPVVLITAAGFLVYSKFATPLYNNYTAYPVLFVIPAIAVAALIGTRIFIHKAAFFKAWLSSAVTILACTFFGVVGLFPNLFPSSLDPRFSLNAYNAASSPLTLTIMLIVVAVFLPIVLLYQLWVYRLFTDKVSTEDLAVEEAY